MRRAYYPKGFQWIGSNYYPINAGLLIDMKDDFLYILPSFPLGAGMPDNKHFEMHIHRHPGKDDGFGVNEYVPDYHPVEHTWVIGIMKMKLDWLWREYLELKGYPVVLFHGNSWGSVEEKLENAKEIKENWTSAEKYQLVEENQCLYVSSLVLRSESYVCRVVNICGKSEEFRLEGFDVVEELNAGGYSKFRAKNIETEGIVEFRYNKNSGNAVIRYPITNDTGKIQPFSLSTYRVSKAKKNSHREIFYSN